MQSDVVLDHLAKRLGMDVSFAGHVGGGSIHQAAKVRIGDKLYFLKYNSIDAEAMFASEKYGLELLRAASDSQRAGFCIPRVIQQGITYDNRYAWLLMEFLEEVQGSDKDYAALGRALASLHREGGPPPDPYQLHTTDKPRFGLPTDNFIGSLPQHNRATGEAASNWASFFITMRLQPQFRMAINSGRMRSEVLSSAERLFSWLSDNLPEVEPSLLHGDLWSGNKMIVRRKPPEDDTLQGETSIFDRLRAEETERISKSGEESGSQTEVNPTSEYLPALFDPAVYYGHREVDLAFTHLFGGFPPSFYQAYNEIWPLDDGADERRDLYNLFPLLAHVNLFGGSYVSSVQQILRRFD